MCHLLGLGTHLIITWASRRWVPLVGRRKEGGLADRWIKAQSSLQVYMNLIFNLQVRDLTSSSGNYTSGVIPIVHGTKHQKVSISCFICQHLRGEEPEEPAIISTVRDLIT